MRNAQVVVRVCQQSCHVANCLLVNTACRQTQSRSTDAESRQTTQRPTFNTGNETVPIQYWHSAGTLGWPFLVLKYIFFQITYTEAILANSTRKLLWSEIIKIMTAVGERNIPPEKNVSGLRSRGHGYVLAICQCSFCKNSYIPRCLFHFCNC